MFTIPINVYLGNISTQANMSSAKSFISLHCLIALAKTSRMML